MRAAAGSDGYFAAPGSGKGENAAFPWDAVLHAGLCLLRLPPRDFWAMTPLEFSIMAGVLRPEGPRMEKAMLAALIARFPDR